MTNYMRYLMVLILTGSAILLVAPIQAQTAIESNRNNAVEATEQASSQQTSKAVTPIQSQLPNPINRDLSVVSEATNPIISNNATEAEPPSRPTRRVPMSSKIFPAPSMQQ